MPVHLPAFAPHSRSATTPACVWAALTPAIRSAHAFAGDREQDPRPEAPAPTLSARIAPAQNRKTPRNRGKIRLGSRPDQKVYGTADGVAEERVHRERVSGPYSLIAGKVQGFPTFSARLRAGWARIPA